MQPVGAHHQAEGARRGALEGDLHLMVVFGEGGDGIGEDVLDLVPGGHVENASQVPTQDLHLTAHNRGGHARQLLAGAVNAGHRTHVGLQPTHIVQDPHALQHAKVCRSPEVDRVAAVARCGRPLHHCGVEAIVAQPVRQRRPSDARLAALFQNVDEDAVDETAMRTVGSFYQALMSGVMVQWLIDPEHAPSGRDLADALRKIVAAVGLADASTTVGPAGAVAAES